MTNLQDLKNSANSADLLSTTNPRNRRKVVKTYFLTELKLISNLQNRQKTGSGQLFT